ncbi:MAG TPA: threonine/serine dehydratase [Woeseiaceae bacterium]|nr:threonine/serine dehydratase [Woeseiaceae bacterium]
MKLTGPGPGAKAMTAQVQQTARAARAASERIALHVRETPLAFSAQFSAASGANVYFKQENLQYTGSFKLRGAFNRLLTLQEAERQAGCVAASSGNHGAALAFAMQKLGISGVIFVPENTSDVKVAAIRACGCEVRFFGTDGLDTEIHARDFAAAKGMYYVSPYNDAEVVAGQGSCGIEIVRQLPAVDAIFIAVGGGGLISGVGSVIREARPDALLFGCQPANSAVMYESLRAGRIVERPGKATLSDGTAGGIEAGAITFDLCRELVDEFVLVNELDIARAVCRYMDVEHQLIEGAAGVAIGGFLNVAERFAGQNIVILVCGANISRATLAKIIATPGT